ncbi:hypothetical protein VOLCADRAFT_74041 [Volvox carteri f. nagariensis]|uniref:Uncharacterized protein n=1 Tax=Volvox carteri f. nagariensis TaxID=3068 RepID=D8TRM4_VOLCA|nr:uncharacterized protein VOLCADRAFT_74041 [Volvox carteri f. nagariensis]EFJ49920.1 hypothetical protein VOLCADRAFT_74041 [Volvox carteri f. nagariensis]|eukprot:XP_002948985.1 hypothetical protein VOLCADRAFT_74041 [Volvox carteri f. nagariensis]
MAHVCLTKQCNILRNVAPFQPATGTSLKARPLWRVCRAGESDNEPSSSGDPGLKSKEASLERLEASIRGKAASPRPSSVGGSPGKAMKPIPIRGVSQQQRKIDSQYENMAEWKEGQLFPEGWESMGVGQKLTELYLGRRGVLFWANKAAYASVFILLGGWILFRFVGPAVGLYKLAGDFAPPPL